MAPSSNLSSQSQSLLRPPPNPHRNPDRDGEYALRLNHLYHPLSSSWIFIIYLYNYMTHDYNICTVIVMYYIAITLVMTYIHYLLILLHTYMDRNIWSITRKHGNPASPETCAVAGLRRSAACTAKAPDLFTRCHLILKLELF